MNRLGFRPMLAGDALQLSMQPAQHFEFGVEHREFSIEEGHELAEGGRAWTAYRGSRIVGIAGFREIFAGHAILWAALSGELGADHLACTRFAAHEIRTAPFHRLEAIVDAGNERAVRWAQLVGLTAGHVLHGYGAAATPHILFERINL